MFKKLNIKSFDIKNFFKTLTKKQKIYISQLSSITLEKRAKSSKIL